MALQATSTTTWWWCAVTCDEMCCNCGNDIGPHHLCTDCLATVAMPIWSRCPMCEDYWCSQHGQHAADCECGDIESLAEVGIDPYRIPTPQSGV